MTGQNPGRHTDNHYGTLYTNGSTMRIALDFFEKYGATLGINDLSLPEGGLFDICGTWNLNDTCANAPKGGHRSHRVGTGVDIDRAACIDPQLEGGCSRGTISVPKDYIGDRCEMSGQGTLVPEGTIHCEFPE